MKNKKEFKGFHVRLKFDTWLFLKTYAAEQNKSMCSLLTEYADKLRNKHQKDLTYNGTNV